MRTQIKKLHMNNFYRGPIWRRRNGPPYSWSTNSIKNYRSSKKRKNQQSTIRKRHTTKLTSCMWRFSKVLVCYGILAVGRQRAEEKERSAQLRSHWFYRKILSLNRNLRNTNIMNSLGKLVYRLWRYFSNKRNVLFAYQCEWLISDPCGFFKSAHQIG